MKTVRIKIYSIGELSREAQEKAWQDWIAEADYPWATDNRASLNEFCERFCIGSPSFSYGGENSHIATARLSSNQYSDDVQNLRGLRLRVWIINNFWHYIEKPKYIRHVKGKARYSKIQKEICCPFTGYCRDDDLLDPLIEFVNKPNNNDSIQDILSACLTSWLTSCQKDSESYFSFENFKDFADSNEYEFKNDGTFYRG